MIRHLFFALALAGPLAAQTPMTAAEFDAYTQGKTLFYGQNGRAYGAEIYHKNRRVQWSFLDGDCKEGIWYEEADQICFVYEDRTDPQCWTFSLGPEGLVAQFEGETSPSPLYEAQDLGQDMLCLGPRIGV